MGHPPDLRVSLTHHVPLVWRDPALGTEHLLLDEGRTPVAITGVPLSAMTTKVWVGDRTLGLSLVFAGKTYVPFTHLTPALLERDPDAWPLFNFLSVHLADRTARRPKVAGGKLEAFLDANTVERPAHGASLWAARVVAERVIHDGETLLMTTDRLNGTVRPETAALRLRSAVSSILYAYGIRTKSLSADPRLRGAVDRLRRIYALLLVDAAPDETVLDGESLAIEAARFMAERHPHESYRRHMHDAIRKLTPSPPRADLESLADLVP